MESVRDTLSQWTRAFALIGDEQINCTVEILLKSDAMAYPFLSIILQEGDNALFPITRMIQLDFNLKYVILSFSDYNDQKILLKIQDTLQLELLVSQYRLCSRISQNTDDEFKDLNEDFLQKYGSKDNLDYISPIYDVHTTYCGVYPVAYDKEAEKTWSRRCEILNATYFTEVKQIEISMLTWNLASGKPTTDIESELTKAISGSPDIAFFGFQEIDMSVGSVVSGNSDYTKEWAEIIKTFVKKYSDLEVVSHTSLGGVFGLLAIKPGSAKFEKVKSVRLGVHGLGANKAVLLFNISAGLSRLSIACAHLVPHDKNLAERNIQLKFISKLVPTPTDYLFVCGDLNYRIDMKYDEAVVLASTSDLPALLKKDQLHSSMKIDPELAKFTEPEILFKPTYKFDPNSNVYDTSQKRRVPSYTDRILSRVYEKRLRTGLSDDTTFESDCVHHFAPSDFTFATTSLYKPTDPLPNFPISPSNILYGCGQSSFSDHRPVFRRDSVAVPAENESRRADFERLQMRKLDELCDIAKPRVRPSETSLKLKVGETAKVIAENVGLAFAKFHIDSFCDSVGVSVSDPIFIPGVKTTIKITAREYVEGTQMIIFSTDQGTLFVIEVDIEKPSLLHKLFKK